MFARTERLLLRPGWVEDAPMLAEAIGREEVASKLTRLPWPYTVADAEAWLGREHRTADADFLIFERSEGAPRLIGGVGLSADGGEVELGYWIVPSRWGRGFATEAGRAVINTAVHSLRIGRLVSGHFVDNPASGRVLVKLGFVATGNVEMRQCLARGQARPCATYAVDLAPMALAA